MIDVQYEEQYTLLAVNIDEPNPELLPLLEQSVVENMEQGNNNFIIYLEALSNAPSDWGYTFDKLKQIVSKENGILVVAAAPETLENKLAELDVVTTPTLDEATDYVFMEEIEKHFWDDEDEAGEEE